MSDDFLRILPCEPGFVPPLERRQAAITALRRFVPDADVVEATVSNSVEFVDPGGNFERVLCPACNTEITRWWVGAMEAAYESRFENLMITLPCCGTSSSLNDLQYDWPAGFARFVLEARNANIGGTLAAKEVSELEALLGCAVKQVLAHY